MKEIDILKQENNKLTIERDILKDSNSSLSSRLREYEETIEKAKTIIKTLEYAEFLDNKVERYKKIDKEINEIKGKEFFDSKTYNKFTSQSLIFDKDTLSIFLGSKKLATINDDKFFKFLEESNRVLPFVLDYYVKSVIVMGATHKLAKERASIFNEINE